MAWGNWKHGLVDFISAVINIISNSFCAIMWYFWGLLKLCELCVLYLYLFGPTSLYISLFTKRSVCQTFSNQGTLFPQKGCKNPLKHSKFSDDKKIQIFTWTPWQPNSYVNRCHQSALCKNYQFLICCKHLYKYNLNFV